MCVYITQGNDELAHCRAFSHLRPFGARATATATVTAVDDAVAATSTAPLTIRSETFCYKKIFNMLNVTWSESPFYVLSCMKIMSNVLCFIWLVLFDFLDCCTHSAQCSAVVWSVGGVYERMHVSVTASVRGCVYTMSPSTRLLIIQAVGWLCHILYDAAAAVRALSESL